MAARSIAGTGRYVTRPRSVTWQSLVIAAAAGLVAAGLSFAALVVLSARLAAAPVAESAESAGAPWPAPGPIIRDAELTYMVTPAPGAAAELRVVLDNPLTAGPTKTILLISGSVLQDFKIHTTHPKLLTQPRRRPDGRYALAFPAPAPQAMTTYRIGLISRTASPQPFQVAVLLESAQDIPEHPAVPVSVEHLDQPSDPPPIVGTLVGWMPTQTRDALPSLAASAGLIGLLVAAGCYLALWTVRR